jgi:methylated-DNA-[protein]-cysteine S-methyltransferase
MALVMRGETALRLSFAHRSAKAATAALNATGSDESPVEVIEAEEHWLARRLAAYATGAEDKFNDVAIDLGPRVTTFVQRVTDRCRRIGWGKTSSYGQLAAAVGMPRAARAVGGVMARNPLAIIVPCHRVLASGGRLGGYSMGTGLPIKRRLLALESVGKSPFAPGAKETEFAGSAVR